MSKCEDWSTHNERPLREKQKQSTEGNTQQTIKLIIPNGTAN